ncbi:hypothetical protein ACFCV9_19880 [Streptomyces sp. NPDC056367]|uniref:hypothetical protein n=1 Tax=unclassified Streptomyces TaxID=2593676 RepID=UPI0035D63A06
MIVASSLRAVAAVVAACALLAGCSEKSDKKEKARAPEAPAKVCWEAFDGAAVVPLLGTGKQVTEDTRDVFALPADGKTVTCRVGVDGATTLTGQVSRKPLGSDAFWQAFDPMHPEKLDFGRKGLVWDFGATLLYTCRTPTESFELELEISHNPTDMESTKVRALNTQLMKDFQDFTRTRLNCAP